MKATTSTFSISINQPIQKELYFLALTPGGLFNISEWTDGRQEETTCNTHIIFYASCRYGKQCCVSDLLGMVSSLLPKILKIVFALEGMRLLYNFCIILLCVVPKPLSTEESLWENLSAATYKCHFIPEWPIQRPLVTVGSTSSYYWCSMCRQDNFKVSRMWPDMLIIKEGYQVNMQACPSACSIKEFYYCLFIFPSTLSGGHWITLSIIMVTLA